MAQFPNDYKPGDQTANIELEARRPFLAAYFYPNMCHVCHQIESESLKLKRCAGCNMISYCGKYHQQKHWPKHKDLCKEIRHLLKTSGSTNLFDFMRTVEDPVQRFKKKRALIDIVEKKLHRNLYGFEQLMFLQPRICVVCSESNPDLLYNCRSCPQGSFCEKHKDDTGHAKLCLNYRICYALDWYNFYSDIYSMIPSVENIPSLTKHAKLPESMDKFLENYMMERPGFWITMKATDLWPSFCSEFYTKPLTLMHVLEKLEFKTESKLIVHVLDVPELKQFEFLTMEILLHLIPQLTTLRIILVSKDLAKEDKDMKPIAVCRLCAARKKSFFIEVFKLPYASYVKSKSFVTPDIVITFDLTIKEFPLWDESTLKMKKIRAPFVITKNSESRALRQHKRIIDLFGLLTDNAHFEKNPFASSKPIRDWHEGGLSFSNNYVAVYTLFETEKEKQSKKKKKRRGKTEEEFPDFVQEEERQARLQQNLAKRKEAAQKSSDSTDESDKLDNFQNSSNSIENSQKSTENNPDNKNGGKRKSKKKKKKAENQVSDSSRQDSVVVKQEKLKGESSNGEKEEKSSNVQKNKDNLETGTKSKKKNSAKKSKEQLEKELLDSTSQCKKANVEKNQEKSQDNSAEEQKSTADSDLKTEDHNLKSEEQLVDSANKINAESTTGENQKKTQANSTEEKKSTAEVSKPQKQNEHPRKSKSKKQKLDSSKQNSTMGNKKKNPGAGAKKPATQNSSEPAANQKERVENRKTKSEEQLLDPTNRTAETELDVQENQEKSQDDLKDEKNSGAKVSESEDSKNSNLKKQLSNLSIESKAESNDGENQEKSRDDSTEKNKFAVEVPMPIEQNEDTRKTKSPISKEKKNLTLKKDKAIDNQGKSNKKKSGYSNQESGNEENLKNPKDQPAGAKQSEGQHSSESTADKKENSENKAKGQKEKKKKSKKNKDKESKNQVSSVMTNSKSGEVSSVEVPVASSSMENNKEFEVAYPEKKEPIQQEEPPNLQNVGIAALAKKSEDLMEENKNLVDRIEKLSAEYLDLKSNGKAMAVAILQEIKVLRLCLESLENRVQELTLDY